MGITKQDMLQQAADEEYEQINYRMDEFLLTNVMGFHRMSESGGIWECRDPVTQITMHLVRPEITAAWTHPVGELVWNPTSNLSQAFMCARELRLRCQIIPSERHQTTRPVYEIRVEGPEDVMETRTFGLDFVRALCFTICLQQGFDLEANI